MGLTLLTLALLGVVVLALAGVAVGIGLVGKGQAQEALYATIGLTFVVLFYASLLFTWGPYLGARLQDLLWTGTRSQQLQFSSRLKARSLALLTLKNWLLIVLTLGLYRPFAVVATTRLKLAAVSITLDGDLQQWLGTQSAQDPNAIGEMSGDFFGFDVGL